MMKLLPLFLVLLVGCPSTVVKEEVQIPLGANVWPAVRANILSGLSSETTDETTRLSIQSNVNTLTKGLDEEALSLIRLVDWTKLRSWAELGVADMVDSGEITPGVATSLLERIKQFSNIMLSLQATAFSVAA